MSTPPSPSDAQSDGQVLPLRPTVGGLGLGTAGILEIGKTGGITSVGLYVLWSLISGDLDRLHKDVDDVSEQVTGVKADVQSFRTELQKEVQDLRTDVTRLQVETAMRADRKP